MALIKCKECGKEISDQAPACPNCGAPKHIAQGLPEAWVAQEPDATPQAQQATSTQVPATAAPRTKSSGCAIVVFVFLGLIILGTLASRCSPSDNQSVTTTNNQPADSANSSASKSLVADLLKQAQDEAISPANRLGIAQALIRNHPGTLEAETAKELLPKLQQLQVEPERASQWRYYNSQDAMSSKPIFNASVTSTNSFEFGFPYQGSQHATLSIRKHPRWGNDVFLTIEKGQILCSTYECPVRIRFDDSPPQTFSGNEPSDNSSETVFIPGYANFTKKLKKAKRVRIEVNVFQQGTLVTEFEVEGFDPEKLSSKNL